MDKHPENTPIYAAIVNDAASGNEANDLVAEPYKDTDSMHVPDTQGGHWVTSLAGRRWLYSIAAALLVVVGGYLGIDAAQQESWLSLAGAILNIGGAGALTYANRKVS